MPADSRLAVGIVLYNNPESELRQMFTSLQRALDYAGISADICLFNNGHAFPDWLNEAATHVLGGGENIGFGRAHNRLMETAFADHEFYLGVNPDGVFHPRCIEKLLSLAERTGGNALIEAMQVPTEHPKPYNPLNGDTPWTSGACFLLSQPIFAATGGFDENIYMYCEDVDFAWRVRLAGYKTKICPEAWFHHDVSGRKPNPVLEQEMFLAARYLGEKWGVPEFRQHIERAMQDRGLSPDPNLLPALAHVEVINNPEKWKIVEFRRMFHFSEARWE